MIDKHLAKRLDIALQLLISRGAVNSTEELWQKEVVHALQKAEFLLLHNLVFSPCDHPKRGKQTIKRPSGDVQNQTVCSSCSAVIDARVEPPLNKGAKVLPLKPE